MNIPVLIVEFKNPEAVKRCIASLPPNAIPFWRDNTDDNIGLTKATNQLFHEAVNPSLSASKDVQYIVWLNQDVQLLPDSLDKAVAFMDAHPKCAIGGFQQRATDDPDLIIHGGTKAAWPAGVHIGGRVSMGACNESKPMGWVNCAASIFRVAALRDIGLLDEQFFLVGQDSDICLRAWTRNCEVWYIAEAVCLHDRGGASSTPSEAQIEMIQKDMNLWSRKWLMVLNGISGADIPIPSE